MQRHFLEPFTIYRGKAAMQISPSPELGLIFINLAPAIPGMENKMPSSGDKKYQWEKKLTVSFNFDSALDLAAVATALMEGKESLVTDPKGNLPSWYRDPKKAGREGNAKTLGFYRSKNQPDGSRRAYYLGIMENSSEKQVNKIAIPLEYADLFKIGRVVEEAALAFLGWRKDIEELKANGTTQSELSARAQADKRPVRWESVEPARSQRGEEHAGSIGESLGSEEVF